MPPTVMPGERHQPGGTITREGAVQGPLRKATQAIAAPMVAQTMLFVSDFTEANGATRLVPGSHMTGSQPDQSVPHVVPSVAAEGARRHDRDLGRPHMAFRQAPTPRTRRDTACRRSTPHPRCGHS